MLMALTAESPGFALRNFTESVQSLFFQPPSCECREATICLNRQQLQHPCLSFLRSSRSMKEYSREVHIDCVQSFTLKKEDL